MSVSLLPPDAHSTDTSLLCPEPSLQAFLYSLESLPFLSLFSPDPAYSLNPENPTSTLSRNGIVGSLVTPTWGFSLYLPSVQPSTLLEYLQVLPTVPNGAQIRFRDSVAGSPERPPPVRRNAPQGHIYYRVHTNFFHDN